MAELSFNDWCKNQSVEVCNHRKLHILTEKDGGRAAVHDTLVATVASHYEEPKRLASRIARLGYGKAAAILREMLPCTKKARSGHLGEILATEAVPALLSPFSVPIKRLRWLDGRESALRGEDFIGIARESHIVRFLKGESKSRATLSPSVVAEARSALKKDHGRPSQHAMGFIMERLFDLGEEELAYIFEEFMLKKTIPSQQLAHVSFVLSGNDGSDALAKDLAACDGDIEQHAIGLRITDHPNFVGAVYERLKDYAADS